MPDAPWWGVGDLLEVVVNEIERECRAHFNEPILAMFEVGRLIGYGEDEHDCYLIIAHPEFGELVALARAKRQAFLEDQLTTSTMGPRVTAMIFALKNAAPHDWLEKTHTEVTGKDGGPIESRQTLEVEGLSDHVLEELLSKLQANKRGLAAP